MKTELLLNTKTSKRLKPTPTGKIDSKFAYFTSQLTLSQKFMPDHQL